MTDQDIIAIKNSLQAIQDSLSNNWWQNLLLVIAGATPTLIIAYYTHKWNVEKETKLFALSAEKEDRRIKTELVGKIKAAENDLLISGMQYLASETGYDYYFSYDNAWIAMNGISKFQEQITKNLEPRNIKGLEFKQNISLFGSLIAQYNYLVKDEKIDELFQKVESLDVKYDHGFETMNLDQLKSVDLKEATQKTVTHFRVEFGKQVRTLVHYIVLNKQ